MTEKLNKTEPVILSLGSNLGDREVNILEAADALSGSKDVSLRMLSSLYETEPVDGDYAGTFINAAVLLRTGMTAGELLYLCRRIEEELGGSIRSRGYDRTIDIDIILLGSLVLDTVELIVPHPRFRERAFVVKPVLEICPDLRIPPRRVPLSEMVATEELEGWTRVVSCRYSPGFI